jgi:hypothetical protein
MSPNAVLPVASQENPSDVPAVLVAVVETGKCSPLYVRNVERKQKFPLSQSRTDRYIVATATTKLKQLDNIGSPVKYY